MGWFLAVWFRIPQEILDTTIICMGSLFQIKTVFCSTLWTGFCLLTWMWIFHYNFYLWRQRILILALRIFATLTPLWTGMVASGDTYVWSSFIHCWTLTCCLWRRSKTLLGWSTSTMRVMSHHCGATIVCYFLPSDMAMPSPFEVWLPPTSEVLESPPSFPLYEVVGWMLYVA